MARREMADRCFAYAYSTNIGESWGHGRQVIRCEAPRTAADLAELEAAIVETRFARWKGRTEVVIQSWQRMGE